MFGDQVVDTLDYLRRSRSPCFVSKTAALIGTLSRGFTGGTGKPAKRPLPRLREPGAHVRVSPVGSPRGNSARCPERRRIQQGHNLITGPAEKRPLGPRSRPLY